MITDGENKLVKNYINDNNVKSAFDYFEELPNLAFTTIVFVLSDDFMGLI